MLRKQNRVDNISSGPLDSQRLLAHCLQRPGWF